MIVLKHWSAANMFGVTLDKTIKSITWQKSVTSLAYSRLRKLYATYGSVIICSLLIMEEGGLLGGRKGYAVGGQFHWDVVKLFRIVSYIYFIIVK